MFTNFLKLAWRNLVKHKIFSTINILGLATGAAVTFLMMNYVSHGFSYDRQHHLKDRIYRVESQFYENNQLTDNWPSSSFGYGSAMKKELKGIEDFVRVAIHNTEQVIKYGDIKIREEGIAYTEPAFFRLFDFVLLQGDKTTALARANSVVITASAARQFFGNSNPMGKILRFASGEQMVDYAVTGVLQDFPVNSHLHFNFLLSYEGLPAWQKEFWYMHEVYTYVLLQPGIAPSSIERGFPAMAEKYKTAEALRNKKWAVSLVPLTSIHLNPQKAYEREIKGNRTALITLAVIAFIILITAWINYTNLTTARSLERAREVGIRKVAGALRGQLIAQFLAEAGIINLAAMLIAVIMIMLSHQFFNGLTGTPVSPFFLASKPAFWIVLPALLLAGTFLSGFYPAFVLSRITPSLILKGKYGSTPAGSRLQQVLLTAQFSAALFLMTAMFIVQRQVKFMQQQELGVNINRTIVLKYPVSSGALQVTTAQFAEKIKTMPGIEAVTVAGSVPGKEVAKFASNRLAGNSPGAARLYEMLTVDYDYTGAFGLQLAAGRSFTKNFGDEINHLLINEACLPQLGFTSASAAVGQKVLLEGEQVPVTIIGVLKNWHQRGLGNIYTPIMLILNGRISWVPPQYIAVKPGNQQLQQSLQTLKAAWQTYFPDSSFDSFFLDSFFAEQYKADEDPPLRQLCPRRIRHTRSASLRRCTT